MPSPPVQPHTGSFLGPEVVLLVGLLLVLAGNVAVRAMRVRVQPSAGAVAANASASTSQPSHWPSLPLQWPRWLSSRRMPRWPIAPERRHFPFKDEGADYDPLASSDQSLRARIRQTATRAWVRTRAEQVTARPKETAVTPRCCPPPPASSACLRILQERTASGDTRNASALRRARGVPAGSRSGPSSASDGRSQPQV